MAFEQPLEADRIDDPFGTFLLAPVLGTLQWILKGENRRIDHDDNEEDDNPKQQLQQQQHPYQTHQSCSEQEEFLDATESGGYDDDCWHFLTPDDSATYHRQDESLDNSSNNCNGMRKAAPSLAGSEVSDVGECAEAFDQMNFRSTSPPRKILRKERKELSWSDESGQDLVMYGNENGARHEPKLAMEPVKSAMSRSSTVMANANRMVDGRLSGSNVPDKKNYLPKGISRANNGGIIMPTMPYKAGEPSASAVDVSPQWGWYINTTPPTPDVYGSVTQIKHGDLSSLNVSSSAHSSKHGDPVPSFAPVPQVGQPNRIFQGLQGKKAAPMGWPGVPL